MKDAVIPHIDPSESKHFSFVVGLIVYTAFLSMESILLFLSKGLAKSLWLLLFSELLYFLFFVIAYYLVLPKAFGYHNKHKSILLNTGFIVGFTLLFTAFFSWIRNIHIEAFFTYLCLVLFHSCLIFLLAFMGVILNVYFHKKEESLMQAVLLYGSEKKLMEVKMSRLQGIVDYHFIANVLSSCYLELEAEAPKTAAHLNSLAQLIHYSHFTMSIDEKVALSIELEQLAILSDLLLYFYEGSYLDIQIDAGEMHDTKKVIPQLLSELLQNMFKHGFLKDKNEPGIFQVSINDEAMIVKTANKINACHIQSSGVGLQAFKTRLDYYYPDKYYFKVDQKNSYFYAELKIIL